MSRNRKIIIAATEISVGGLGSYIDTLAMRLKSGGWEVHLVSTSTRGDLFDRMRESVECHDFSAHPLSGGKILTAAELVNHIAPDILLMNNCALLHYALPLIKTTARPVAVLHSDDIRFYKTASLFEKRIFRWIAPTRGVAERCRTFLQPQRGARVRTIPHGIENKMFTAKESGRRRISGNVSFAGFIAQNKGADLLPDIFSGVSKAYGNARFTIVGSGPLEQTLKRQCEENGTLHKCNFTGTVDHARMAEILRESDILILPTRIEGFGLSVVEAMMSGAVPVVSRIEGVTDDIVSDGLTGVLINPDDARGFATAIVDLLKNPGRLLSMSEMARQDALRRYSAEKMLDAYLALFDEEDDRVSIQQRGTMGWIIETVGEKGRKGVDRRWLLHRAMEIWGGRVTGKADKAGPS